MLANKSKQQLKVVVFREFDDYIPEFYKNFELSGPKINEELASEVEHWTPENPVLIDAPPGTGKTTFVYSTLIPTAIEAGRNLLLISNRIALSSQQKVRIMDILNSPLRKLLTPEGIRKHEDFGSVQVITYHRLPALLEDPEVRPWLADLAFTVFDEAHFFVADATFNERCDYYLKLATTRFCRAIRVYLSATTWDILVPLANAEEQSFRVSNFEPLILRPSIIRRQVFCRTFYRYWMPASNSRYRLLFFKDLVDLIPHIKDQADEKWLVFTDRKPTGRQFCEALANRATYVDADSKGTDAWDELIREEKFSSQVLVTTSVLDCGINIHDPALKHIAVIADNRVSLTQMIGRKRLDPGEQVELWVCDLDQRVISARANRYRAWLTWFDRLDHCTSAESKMKVAEDIWRAGNPSLMKLFRLADNTLFPNELAHWSIQRRLHVFRKILSGETTFREIVASWLGIEPPAKQDQCAQLKTFYDDWGEKPLFSEQQAELRNIICRLYSATGHKDPQPRRVSNLGCQALSNRLREMEFPYQITSDGNAWLLHCTREF